jgi:hypothetical protein
VICRSPLIHVEVEFKLSFTPLSRRDLIFKPSGQEFTQYLDSISIAFAAPARWARTSHNPHSASSTACMESSTETTLELSKRWQPPRVTSQWTLPSVPPSASRITNGSNALGALNHSLECNLKQEVWEIELEDYKCMLGMVNVTLTHELHFYL